MAKVDLDLGVSSCSSLPGAERSEKRVQLKMIQEVAKGLISSRWCRVALGLWPKMESPKTPRFMIHVGPSPVGKMETELSPVPRSLLTACLSRTAQLWPPAVLKARAPPHTHTLGFLQSPLPAAVPSSLMLSNHTRVTEKPKLLLGTAQQFIP